jgi:hypothetical protein
MKRLREKKPRKERSVLEIVATEEMEDLALEIITQMDYREMRCLAQVSRQFNVWVLKWMERLRYFRGLWTSSAGGSGECISVTTTGEWPPCAESLSSLADDFSQPEDNFHLGAMAEIDQTDESSRSYYTSAKKADMPPLLPLDYARALAKRRKQAEFEAMLRAAAQSGLLASLLPGFSEKGA